MTPSKPGIYVAQPIDRELVPVTRDPRYVESCARVNCMNVKIGKARNLAAREKNYHKDFDPTNIIFEPLVITDAFQEAETAILRTLKGFRKRSPKGGLMDWLEGISLEDATRAVFTTLDREQIRYIKVEPQ